MSEKERISNPSMGSNKVGSETRETKGSGMPAGTDTQTQMAALSKKKEKSDINDDELVVKNEKGKSQLPKDSGD